MQNKGAFFWKKSSWLSLNPIPYATSLSLGILHCVTISNVLTAGIWMRVVAEKGGGCEWSNGGVILTL